MTATAPAMRLAALACCAECGWTGDVPAIARCPVAVCGSRQLRRVPEEQAVLLDAIGSIEACAAAFERIAQAQPRAVDVPQVTVARATARAMRRKVEEFRAWLGRRNQR